MDYNNKYQIDIFERYTDLKNSNKEEFDNNDLCKIFEYYTCIKLSEELNRQFIEYNDIDPNFKELNKMSRNDTGIDCCDLINTIVQCKLRKNTLNWKECSTFFGSQNIYSDELNKPIIRWDNLIITRNNECKLSENLLIRKKLFIDKSYSKDELINYCENLITNPPTYPIFNEDYQLRDYQLEAIDLIKSTKKNTIINLPTGTGKNSIIIYSMKVDKKYLILVPRIILMDQLKKEIIKHKPNMKNKIQLIGDNNHTFDKDKLITICVFNSIHLIEEYCMIFEKIYIDEAHHINKPAIYDTNDDENISDDMENNSDDINNDIEDINDNIEDDSDVINNDMEDIKDDSEDELINVKNYTKIIKDLTKLNNNVYLSATIDQINDFEFYSRDIRSMIDLGYLSDYQIHIPIFNDDPTNKNICMHLLQNYRNIIIYCSSQKEGKLINKLMNELQPNSSEYIDCLTSKTSRNDIIDRYKNGQIPFLINVRILVEGFDAPITKGVCFLHLPSSKTTLIQIIGRALRLHPTKTIANVILPFSSKEDKNNICKFLKVMASNDSRIRRSFESKNIGSYIQIETIDDSSENEDIEFKYNMVYNSMGILINGEEIWMNKLERVKSYIDTNNKIPSRRDKDIKIKSLNTWITNQKTNYRNRIGVLSNDVIYTIWTEFINDDRYKSYFFSNEENWNNTLNKVIQYINLNNKRPSQTDKDIYIRSLGGFICTQQKNYKNKKCIMLNEEIYKLWTEFIYDDNYKSYFLSDEENWNNTLKDIKQYIDTTNKLPSTHDKNKQIKILGSWISNQKNNYRDKKNIMSNGEIYNKWTDFINDDKYILYFISNEEKWKEKFNEVKQYIDTNNKIPSSIDKDNQIQLLGRWISTQKQNYKTKKDVMSHDEIYTLYTEFINDDKYKLYFLSNEELWKLNLDEVKIYIDINKKRPSESNKDTRIKYIGRWINTQQSNYKNKKEIMTNEEIYKLWTEFIDDDRYKSYFFSNEENWNNTLNKVIQYINLNNKRPSQTDKDTYIRSLGYWTSDQIHNYNNKKCIMSNEEIYKLWTEFINDDKYNIYFISNEELWNLTFNDVKNYIDSNNKKPSDSDKNKEIKILGNWINRQQSIYKTKERIMSNEEIYSIWTNFINDDKYIEYFLSNDKLWNLTFNNVKQYINIHNKKPSKHDKDKKIKSLSAWICTQQRNYKNKECIMTNEEIYQLWTNFINDEKYKKYFKSNESLNNEDVIIEQTKKKIIKSKK